jgi:hypothetical protein
VRAGSSHLIGTAISGARDLAGHSAIGRIFPPQNDGLAGAQFRAAREVDFVLSERGDPAGI